MKLQKIVVVGMGYVGIPAAALFADVKGFSVVGIQRRSQRSGWKIDWLNQGKNPIGGDEPGLSELIARVVKKGTFRVTDNFSQCADTDIILIDVQTPTDEKGIPHYDALKEACTQIGHHLKKDTLVIIESTVAPGTTLHIVKPILEKESGLIAGKDFGLAFSYERVMVGRLLHNITQYPRIIGGINKESEQKALELYKHIVKAKLYVTDILTAEVAKVVENAYRDVNIAFANEIALLCESLGVDVFKVRELVNTLPYDPSNPSANPIRNMHFPGAGVGGHCLPKDSWLLKYGVDSHGQFKVTPELLVRSRMINESMPVHIGELLEEAFKRIKKTIKGAKIALLGVAFLENSDDTRNTPVRPLYDLLKKKGALPVLHDTFVKTYDLPVINNLNEVIRDSDALVIVTKHREYLDLNLNEIKKIMRNPIIIDGRNAFNKNICEEKGFIYLGVGKPR